MRIAERDAVFHQNIGKVRSEEGREHAIFHLVKVPAGCRNGFAHHAEKNLYRMRTVKDRLLVFLEVAAVRQRSALHQGEHRRVIAEHTTRLTADQFHGIRVLLLRHHGRTARERVGKGEVTEFGRAPNHEVFCVTAERIRDDREIVQKFKSHVAVRNCVDTVCARAFKTEFFGDELTVVRECGTCDRTASERKFYVQIEEVVETLHIAGKRKEEAHHVMAKENRLGLLQVRVARHDLAKVFLGNVENAFLKFHDKSADFFCAVAHIKLEVGRNLVVTASARMNLFAEIADTVGQNAFHGHVDIFICREPKVLAGVDIIEDTQKAFANLGIISFGKNAGFDKSLSVAKRALDIFFQKLLVKIQAKAEIDHALGHSAIEAAVPHHFFAFLFGHLKPLHK